MSDHETGPGELNSDAVGQFTISRSFLLTPRQIMAYAAAVGDTNEAYFDDLREDGLIGHPCMAFAFQWNTRFSPQLSVNVRALPFNVHATTDLRIHKPFAEGELITCQGSIISTQQIRPGVLTTSRYRMTDSKSELVAELDMGGITRGAALKGDDVILEPPVPAPVINSEAEPVWEEPVRISADAAQVYTECAEIYNPIHTERKVAKAAGLPDIILHGSATQAISLSRVINRCLDGDAGRVRRYMGQLRAMVMMDSMIRVRCLGVEQQGENQVISFDVLNEAGETAVANGRVIAG
jgi:acyl dehydratase